MAAITKLSPPVGCSTFGTQCSFVDEIKLNYSLANTILQYVRVAMHIRLCTISVKCLLVNYCDTTSSSIFSHHTIPGSGRRGVRPNPTNPAPGSATVMPIIMAYRASEVFYFRNISLVLQQALLVGFRKPTSNAC